MGNGQAAYAASGGVNGGNQVVFYTDVSFNGQPLTASNLAFSGPDVLQFICHKHRVVALELVGEEVQGTCAGCGDKVVLPSLPQASKLLVMALGVQERVTALGQLPRGDARRGVVNVLPDLANLTRLVELAGDDMDTVQRVLRLIRTKVAQMAAQG